MIGLDRRHALSAEPPLPPADQTDLTEDVLASTADKVAERAEAMGLTEWFWGEGVVLQGMQRLARALGEPAPGYVTEFIDGHLTRGIVVEHVNNLAPGAACADLWQATGDPRYADVCDQLLAWMQADGAATFAPNGAMEHWPGGVWADTVFMAGSFLIRFGLASNRPDLVVQAGRQVLAHAELLQDPETGLYAHGSHHNETIWCFWGRANAWTALASAEFCEAVSALGAAGEESEYLTALDGAVRERLERQLVALADLQPDHGVWDVLVDGQVENRGILETSAAAGLAAAMLRAAALGIVPERLSRSGWQALAGVHSYIADDGTLTRTSAGTILQLIPFGYSVIRTDLIQPWGQGLALHAYAAALDHLTT